MRALLAGSILAAVAAAAPPLAPAQQAGASKATGPVTTADEVRIEMRRDKRGLVERNMQLTADEGAKFWPIYDSYQRELDRVIERENRLILDYVNAENVMTDGNAKRIARELLKAEDDEQSLRAKQFRRMLAVLPAKKAVRYLQIENKLRTLQRYDVAEHIPLVR
jgi:Spy/CpxP family protein refolding chaperone